LKNTNYIAYFNEDILKPTNESNIIIFTLNFATSSFFAKYAHL